MTKSYTIAFIFPALLLGGCHSGNGSGSLFNRDSLAQHIIVLASDSLQGRKPFSPAEPKVVAYMAGTFRRLGLEPGNGNSYVQEVPLVEITPNGDSTMTVASARSSFALHKMDDYVLSTENPDSLAVPGQDARGVRGLRYRRPGIPLE